MRYGRGILYLSHGDFDVDWESLKFVVVDEAYPTEYASSVVLDVGAHKGYYGAYALAHGARTVISFEPEAANCELLERAAATYREHGADWRVRRVAMGAEQGRAELHVMSASWGHALHPPAEFSEHEVGIEQVPVEAMADVLEEAAALADSGSKLVVKVNTEGEECDIVLGTPAGAWAHADEVFVEIHPWAACGAAELASHLLDAGLTQVPSEVAPVLRLRREAPPRSDPHSAPT